MKPQGLRSGIVTIVIIWLSLFFFACQHKHLNSIQPNSIFSVGKIRGVVYGDSIGAPIPAYVILLHNSSTIAKTQANKNGEFEFSNLKPEKYGLLVDWPLGFEYAKIYNIQAAPDSVTVVTMQLRRSYDGGITIERDVSIPLNLKIDILPMTDTLQSREIK